MKIKILICLMMLLAVSACKGGNIAESESFGRYVEIEITPPVEGRFMSFLTQDDKLMVVDQELSQMFSSSDGGETWDNMPLDIDAEMSVTAGTLMPDGRFLVFIQNKGLAILSADGTMEDFPVSEIDTPISQGRQVTISFMQVLGDDRFLLEYTVMDNRGMVQGQTTQRAQRGAVVRGAESIEETEEPEETEESDEPEESEEPQETEESRQPRRVNMGGGFHQGLSLHELSTGALVTEIQNISSVAGAAARDGYFFLLETGGGSGTIRSFTSADGAPVPQSEIDLGSGFSGMNFISFRGASSGNVLAINNEGELFAMHLENILRIKDGEVTEFLEGTAFSFGSPSSNPVDLMILSDGSVVLNLLDDFTYNRMYKIVWDENASINAQKTLRIWSLENNDLVRAAITELRKSNPDSLITYEIALGASGGVSSSDAIRTLNTQLLSGRGPDILILDGTPVENYAARGMLLDLSGIDTSGVYPNLLEPYILPNGELFTLPTQQLIPVLAGMGEIIEQIQNLEALTERVVSGNAGLVMNERIFGGVPQEERPELHFDNLQEMTYILWRANLPAIIGDNQLDSDMLRRHLSAVKAISDKYGLGEPIEEGHTMIASFGGRGGRAMFTGSVMRYMAQTTNLAVFPVEHLMTFQIISGRGWGMLNPDDTEIVPFPGLAGGVWQPSSIVGISADTEVADFAKQFVGAMLSLNVQQSNHGEGLPITRAGIAEQVEQINERQRDMEQPTIDIDIDSLIGQLTTPALVERALYEMIFATKERLCSGVLDLEGAVREIEQNIRNYLAERS
jgi:hypothetical protein